MLINSKNKIIIIQLVKQKKKNILNKNLTNLFFMIYYPQLFEVIALL